jgi:UDP-N-acetylglucosamine acyltransferase
MDTPRIHPTACVDSAVRLGAEVEIGPYSVVGPEVEVGEGCRLGPHVVIHPHTRLGPRCRVHAHAVLGDLPQDLGFRGGVSGVEIGADCWIREGVTIHRGSAEGSVTRVGEGCLLMVNSHLGHNVTLGRRVILANGVLLAGHVQVGDGAFLSGNVIIHQFTRIGRLAMLSGGSGIGKDVLPFCTTASLHTNRIAGLNIVGLRRAGMTPADRLQLKRAYHIVFRQGLALPAARAALEAEFKDGPVSEWLAFMNGSRRGICTRDLCTPHNPEADAE